MGVLVGTMCIGFTCLVTSLHVQKNIWQSQVFRQRFWMMKHGAKCAKPTIMWSTRKLLIAGLVFPSVLVPVFHFNFIKSRV